MKNKLHHLFLFLTCLIMVGNSYAGDSNTHHRVVLFDMGDEASKYYRIPALVTATDGSLIAIADKRWEVLNDLPSHIDIVARRSTDNGQTWSPAITIAGQATETGYGDAAVVVDQKTGNILCIFASGNGLWQSTPNDPIRINTSISKDNGLTWSAPKEITNQIYGAGCTDPIRKKWFGAFAASGRALQLRNGRIMFVIAVRTTSQWGGPMSNYVCYSDDGGETWNVSNTPGDYNGDEAKVVELNNGNILMSIRNREKGNRKFSISKDRGETWEDSYLQPDILEPACNGDIIRYTSRLDGYYKNRLLHSIPYDKSIRQNISILISYDEGETWCIRKTIYPGTAAYSSMTILPDGSIGVLVEEGKWDNDLPGKDGFAISFMRFTLDWLTDGRDRYLAPKFGRSPHKHKSANTAKQ